MGRATSELGLRGLASEVTHNSFLYKCSAGVKAYLAAREINIEMYPRQVVSKQLLTLVAGTHHWSDNLLEVGVWSP